VIPGQRSRIDSSWRDDAQCRFADLDLFFPNSTVGIEEIQAAKELCQSCPVQSPCLDYALVTNQENGIWGGTTEGERRRLRRAWLADRRRRKAMIERAS
jgi:WhiB family transcriptional regulator, redox-sensing transcriptional regulator